MRRSVLGQSPWKHIFLEQLTPSTQDVPWKRELYIQLYYQRLSYLPTS